VEEHLKTEQVSVVAKHVLNVMSTLQ